MSAGACPDVAPVDGDAQSHILVEDLDRRLAHVRQTVSVVAILRQSHEVRLQELCIGVCGLFQAKRLLVSLVLDKLDTMQYLTITTSHKFSVDREKHCALIFATRAQ